MKLTLVAIAGSMLWIALGAPAQPLFEVSPHFGYRWGGDFELATGQTAGLQDGRAYGVSLDYSTSDNPSIKLELLWSRQDSGFDLEEFGMTRHLEMTVDQFQIGGVWEGSRGRLRGYLTGLAGASLFDPQGADPEAFFSLGIGGGVKYFLLPNLALRADLRGFCTVVESESAVLYYNGVTLIRFSGNTMWQGEVSAGITLAF